MKTNLRGVVVRLTAFVVVCLLGVFALAAIFAQLRFEPGNDYNAEFTDVTNLQEGNFVRIAGVEVGKVLGITIRPDAVVVVKFSADDTVAITEGTRAIIRYDNLIGGRYLELQEGPGSTVTIKPGQTIPVDHTEPALDLDSLIGGFRPLFKALDPDQVNALSGQLIAALQGQGDTIGSFLNQTASLTSTLADRDQLIGEVIGNLNVVLGSLGDQSSQFDKAVTSLADLVEGLAARRTDISNGVAHAAAAAATVADLLMQARPPFTETVHQTDRVSGLVQGDRDYVDNVLETLPEAYQTIGRLGLYGDFFSFYLCDVILKVNGKGGQPVYIKAAGQDTGRCAPK